MGGLVLRREEYVCSSKRRCCRGVSAEFWGEGMVCSRMCGGGVLLWGWRDAERPETTEGGDVGGRGSPALQWWGIFLSVERGMQVQLREHPELSLFLDMSQEQ